MTFDLDKIIESKERYCENTATRLAQGALDFGGAA